MSRSLKQVCVLILMACLPAVVAAFVSHPRWNLDALAEDEMELARALEIQPPALWVDARSKTAYANDHIPGALPLNEEEWRDLFPRVVQSWQPGTLVVVYCNSRSCDASRDVASRLRKLNVTPVYILHGGWEAWKRK